MPPSNSERLWVCDRCKMIGSEAEATAHRIAIGHEVEALPQDVSDAVTTTMSEQQAQRVGALIHARRAGLVGPRVIRDLPTED